jgi:hypothetical protein
LEKPRTVRFRPVLGVAIGDGKAIHVNDPVNPVLEQIGEGRKTEIVRRTNIHRRKYDDEGLELVCTDRVIAIRLRSTKSPPLMLQASGPGGVAREIRVGMAFDELEKLLAGDATGWDTRYGTQTSVVYRYFYNLGFGVRVSDEGTVTEIMVAQIPAEAKVG